MSKTNDVPKKTVAQKLHELETAAAWFRSDDFSIEEAIDRFAALKKQADELEIDLATVENTVREIERDFSGE